MSVLHLINKSPFSHSAAMECLQMVQPGDSILLLEEGVYGALEHSPLSDRLKALQGVAVCALEPDLTARAISTNCLPTVRIIGMADFVQLAIAHEQSLSWF